MKFYSMKNKFQDKFNTPFPADNDAQAIYQIRIVINQKKEPEIIADDFALYFVGEFNEDRGNYDVYLDPELPVCLIEDCSTLKLKKEGGAMNE